MAKNKKAIFQFAGLSLGGGKTDRTSLAVIEYYKEPQRIFLRHLKNKISGSKNISGDSVLLQYLQQLEKPIDILAVDVPLQLPKCIRCTLKCPGFEKCKQPEIKWMWNWYLKKSKTKKPVKIFTPYTDRCGEMYIETELEEEFFPQHALGANLAPLTARAFYLLKHFKKIQAIEYLPKLSLWRMGRSLGLNKSQLRFNRHAMDGDELRHAILQHLIDKRIVFIYQQDIKLMVDDPGSFDAFMGSLTAFLMHRKQTQPKPSNFPKSEIWPVFPKEEINWFDEG